MANDYRNNPSTETPLESWKEVAAYLQREVRTVIRWEKTEGLPIHRHHHLSRSSVFAYPSELDAWRAARRPATEVAARPVWRRPLPSAAFALVLLLALVSVGSGPRIGMTALAADGIVTRQVWTGPDADAWGTPSPDGRYLTFLDDTGNLAVRDLTTGQNRRLTNKEGGWENWHEYAGDSVFSPDGKQIAFGWYNQHNECELRVVGRDGSEPRVLYRAEKHDIRPADWSQDGKLVLAHLAHLRTGGNRVADMQIVAVAAADGSLSILKTLDKTLNWSFPSEMHFSPDSRFVGYDLPAGEAGDSDIFTLSVASGQVAPLVQHPAQERMLGWAPGGKSVLFLSDRTGSWGVWRVPVADGRPLGEPRLVKRDVGAIRPMGFTREGSFYYGVRDRGYNVYTGTLDGGAPSLLVERYLGANSGPAWSPDGKSIAYLSRRSPPASTTTLCIRSMETGREREYSPNLAGFTDLEWSPDGKSMLCLGTDLQSQNGSYKIDLETGQVAPVHIFRHGSRGVRPRWSADGTAVYFIEPWGEETKRPARLMRRNLGTGRDEEIRLLPEGVTNGFVLPSPDGRWLALWVIRGDQGSLAITPMGAPEIRELPGPWTDVEPLTLTWAPDSRQIVFIRREGRGKRSELWGVPVERGEPRSLGFAMMLRAMDLSIHPDGQQVALSVFEPTQEVWVMENFLPRSEVAQ